MKQKGKNNIKIKINNINIYIKKAIIAFYHY